MSNQDESRDKAWKERINELARRAKAGDQGAMSNLRKALVKLLAHSFRERTGDQQRDAEDKANEAIGDAVPKYDGPGDFVPFAFGCLNILVLRRRREIRQEKLKLLFSNSDGDERDNPFANKVDPNPSPEERAVSGEELESLRECMNVLNEVERRVIRSRWGVDNEELMPWDRLAVELDEKRTTLCDALKRAESKLLACMRRKGHK